MTMMMISQPNHLYVLSKSVNSSESTTSMFYHILHRKYKFTQKSDIYSFGIVMYQIADGEPPFRNYSSDDNLLAKRICEGLRPEMPDSAPDEYEKLAERCCDADHNRPEDGRDLWRIIYKLIEE